MSVQDCSCSTNLAKCSTRNTIICRRYTCTLGDVLGAGYVSSNSVEHLRYASVILPTVVVRCLVEPLLEYCRYQHWDAGKSAQAELNNTAAFNPSNSRRHGVDFPERSRPSNTMKAAVRSWMQHAKAITYGPNNLGTRCQPACAQTRLGNKQGV